MSSEASRLAASIGGVEERVSSEAKQLHAEKTQLDRQLKRLQAFKVGVPGSSVVQLVASKPSDTLGREFESR